jgi:hypothetical protein
MVATVDASAAARGVIQAKGKRLVRRTILLFLGTMLVMLVAAGGVAFAYNCTTLSCQCKPGRSV